MKINILDIALRADALQKGEEGYGLNQRKPGQRVREKIIGTIDTIIKEVPPQKILEIDYSKILWADPSFLQEAVIELQLYIREQDVIIYYTNLNEDIEASIQMITYYMLNHSGPRVVVLSYKNNLFNCIGPMEDRAVHVFSSLQEEKRITSRVLHERLKISPTHAATQLKRLWDLNLISRENNPYEKNSHIYLSPAVHMG